MSELLSSLKTEQIRLPYVKNTLLEMPSLDELLVFWDLSILNHLYISSEK